MPGMGGGRLTLRVFQGRGKGSPHPPRFYSRLGRGLGRSSWLKLKVVVCFGKKVRRVPEDRGWRRRMSLWERALCSFHSP